MNYYLPTEDEAGDYVSADGTRYSVQEVAPARVHIPVGREGELTLYDSLDEYLEASQITQYKIPE